MSNRITRTTNFMRRYNCSTYKNLATLDLLNYIDGISSIVQVNNHLNKYANWPCICRCCDIKRLFRKK